jgi:hypothetical protein
MTMKRTSPIPEQIVFQVITVSNDLINAVKQKTAINRLINKMILACRFN